MVDLIALGVVALASYLGWRTGLLAALLACFGIVAAYVLAWIFYKPLGDLIASSAELPPWVSYGVAGMSIVTVVMIVTGFYRRRHVKRRRARTFRSWDPPVWDQLGGAVVAGCWSSMVVLLVVWVLIGLQVVFPKMPDVRASLIGELTARAAANVAHAVVEQRTGDAGLARTAATLARDPRQAPQALGNVLKNPRVQKLLRERWAVAGARRRHLNGIASDPELLREAHRAGLLQTDPAELSPEAAVAELDAGLAPISRGMKVLAEDPKVRKMLNDPKLMRKLQDGDVSELARDPNFNQLMQKLLRQMSAPPP